MKNTDATFTQHVKALARGDTISAQGLAPMWKKLRRAVQSELRQRGLYRVPPRYLGVYGVHSWTPEAFEELLLDCYSAAFLHRLRSLRGQLKVRGNIDGLIFRNIRNYLHDRQKKHDPLGFRVFNLLRSAVLEAVEAGEWFVLEGGATVSNSTVLVLAGTELGNLEPVDDLDDIAASWNDDLLPDLVTALGKAQHQVIARLRGHLRQLAPRHQVRAFTFRALCNPLKNDARRRWAAAWQEDEGEVVIADSGCREFVSACTSVETTLATRDHFATLLRAVESGLERWRREATVDSVTLDYLRRLWIFYRCHACGLPVPGLEESEAAVSLPSQRQLALLLEIPRDRLPRLHRLLQQLVEDLGAKTETPKLGQFQEQEARAGTIQTGAREYE